MFPVRQSRRAAARHGRKRERGGAMKYARRPGITQDSRGPARYNCPAPMCPLRTCALRCARGQQATLRSTCGGRWLGPTRRTPPWRSTSTGRSRATRGSSRQSTRSTYAPAGQRPGGRKRGEDERLVWCGEGCVSVNTKDSRIDTTRHDSTCLRNERAASPPCARADSERVTDRLNRIKVVP